MYSVQKNIEFMLEELNKQLKRQGMKGTIILYSLGDEISLFYENNGSRYFFFFPLQRDKTKDPYKGDCPIIFDPEGIVGEIRQKLRKINTSYIA